MVADVIIDGDNTHHIMEATFKAMGRALDIAAGFSQGFFGISGPISMTRLLGSSAGKHFQSRETYLEIDASGYDPASGMVEPWVVYQQLEQLFELRSIDPLAGELPDEDDAEGSAGAEAPEQSARLAP